MLNEDYVHVFDEYYISNDSLNMIVFKKGVIQSGKNKGNEKYSDDGFYTSSRALLNGLMRKYSVRYIKEIVKTGNFINLESFVSAVEQVETKFAKERTGRNKL